MKTPVIVRPEYTYYLERYEGSTFAHCDVHKWTPRVAKKMTEEWKVLADLHGEPIFCLHDTGDLKHEKFITMLGFFYVQTLGESPDGITRDLYVCDRRRELWELN